MSKILFISNISNRITTFVTSSIVEVQFIIQITVLMGWLPIIGLPNFGY